MMYKQLRLAGTVTVLLFVGAILFSCKSTKKIQTAISKKDTALVVTSQSGPDSLLLGRQLRSDILSRQIDFTTFASKIKVEYADSKGKQQNVTAYVQIKKDSVIWMSLYATLFNLEAFRVLIKPDSVIVMDKLNKEVQYRSLDYLQEVTEIPFDFKTLQDLILGNPIYLDSNIVQYRRDDVNSSISSIGQYFKNLLTVSNSDTSLVRSKLDDVDISRNRTADLSYQEYENTNGINFSTNRVITVSEKSRLDIKLKYKQVEFNKDLSMPFNIPKNYKRT